jgi:hypothetical protein
MFVTYTQNVTQHMRMPSIRMQNEAEEKGAGKPGIKELMSKYGKVPYVS